MLNYRKMILLCGSLFAFNTVAIAAVGDLTRQPTKGTHDREEEIKKEVAALEVEEKEVITKKDALLKEIEARRSQNDEIRNSIKEKYIQLIASHKENNNTTIDDQIERDKAQIIASLREFHQRDEAGKIKFMAELGDSIKKLSNKISSQNSFGEGDLATFKKLADFAEHRLSRLSGELKQLEESNLSFDIKEKEGVKKLKLEQILDKTGKWITPAEGKALTRDASKKIKRHIDEFISVNTVLYLAAAYPILMKDLCPKEPIGKLVKEYLPFFDPAVVTNPRKNPADGTVESLAQVTIDGKLYDVYPYKSCQTKSASDATSDSTLNAEDVALSGKVRSILASRGEQANKLKTFLQSGGVFSSVNILLSSGKPVYVYKALTFDAQGANENEYWFIFAEATAKKETLRNITTDLNQQQINKKELETAGETLKTLLAEKIEPVADVPSEEAKKRKTDVLSELQKSTDSKKETGSKPTTKATKKM